MDKRVLRLQNFGGHDRLEVEFPACGLVRIQGPSGAGKSTVLDAFAWVLGSGSDNPKGVMSSTTQGTGTTSAHLEWEDVEIVRTCRPARHVVLSRADKSLVASDPVEWLVRRYGACLHPELVPICAYLRQGLRCALSSDPTPTYRALADHCLHPLPVVQAAKELKQAAAGSDAVAGDRAKRWREAMEDRPPLLGPARTDATPDPEAELRLPDPPASAAPADEDMARADEAVGAAKSRARAATELRARLVALWNQLGGAVPLPTQPDAVVAVARSVVESGRARRLVDRFLREFQEVIAARPRQAQDGAETAEACVAWAAFAEQPESEQAERKALVELNELRTQIRQLVGPTALANTNTLTLRAALDCKLGESLAAEVRPRAQRAWLLGLTGGPEWAEAQDVDSAASTESTGHVGELREAVALMAAVVAALDEARRSAGVDGNRCVVAALVELVAQADAARDRERALAELEADPLAKASLAVFEGRASFRGWDPCRARDPLPGPTRNGQSTPLSQQEALAAVTFLASLCGEGCVPTSQQSLAHALPALAAKCRAADRSRHAALFPPGLFDAPATEEDAQDSAAGAGAAEELCIVAADLRAASEELHRCTTTTGEPNAFAKACAAKETLEAYGAATAGDARRALLAACGGRAPAGWAVDCPSCGAALRIDPATGASASADQVASGTPSWTAWLLAAPAATAPCGPVLVSLTPEQRAAAAAALDGLGDTWDGAWLPPPAERRRLQAQLATLPDRVAALSRRARAIFTGIYGDLTASGVDVGDIDTSDRSTLAALTRAVAVSGVAGYEKLHAHLSLDALLDAARAAAMATYVAAGARLAQHGGAVVDADTERTARRLLGRIRDAWQRTTDRGECIEQQVRAQHAATVAAAAAEEARLAARDAVALRDRVRAARAACGLPAVCGADEPCFLSRKVLDQVAHGWVATECGDVTVAAATEKHEALRVAAWQSRAGRLARSADTKEALALVAATPTLLADDVVDEAALRAATELIGLVGTSWPDEGAADDAVRACERRARDLRALAAQWAEWRAAERWAEAARQLLNELREAENAATTSRLAATAIQDATTSAVDTVTREIEATANRIAHRLFPEGGVLIRLRPTSRGQACTLTVGVRIGNRDNGVDAVGLSGGERARVDLALQAAACVAMGSPVLLLDESTGSLDPETAALSVAALRAVAADRLVVVASHQLEGECLPLFDSVVRIAPPVTTAQRDAPPPPKRRKKQS